MEMWMLVTWIDLMMLAGLGLSFLLGYLRGKRKGVAETRQEVLNEYVIQLAKEGVGGDEIQF